MWVFCAKLTPRLLSRSRTHPPDSYLDHESIYIKPSSLLLMRREARTLLLQPEKTTLPLAATTNALSLLSLFLGKDKGSGPSTTQPFDTLQDSSHRRTPPHSTSLLPLVNLFKTISQVRVLDFFFSLFSLHIPSFLCGMEDFTLWKIDSGFSRDLDSFFFCYLLLLLFHLL